MPKSRGRKPKKPRAPTNGAPKQLATHNIAPQEPSLPAPTVQQEPSIPPQTVLRSVHFNLGSNVQVVLTTAQTIWEKHWGLIAIYVVFQIAAAIGSYWISGYISVSYSFVTSMISTLIGLFIVTKVITIMKH